MLGIDALVVPALKARVRALWRSGLRRLVCDAGSSNSRNRPGCSQRVAANISRNAEALVQNIINIAFHGGRALVALRDVVIEGAREDALGFRRYLWVQRARRWVGKGRVITWVAVGQDVMQCSAKRVQIGTRVRVALILFGRRVAGRAER